GHGAAGTDLLGLLDLCLGRSGRADRVEQLGVHTPAGREVGPVLDVHRHSRSNRAATASGGALARLRAGSGPLMIFGLAAPTSPRGSSASAGARRASRASSAATSCSRRWSSRRLGDTNTGGAVTTASMDVLTCCSTTNCSTTQGRVNQDLG